MTPMMNSDLMRNMDKSLAKLFYPKALDLGEMERRMRPVMERKDQPFRALLGVALGAAAYVGSAVLICAGLWTLLLLAFCIR